MSAARKAVEEAPTPEEMQRVFLLMDGQTNRQRYERQTAEEGEV